MRTKQYRKKQRHLKIKKRQKMIKSIAHPIDYMELMPNNKHLNKVVRSLDEMPGLLDKHDYGAITSGVSIKTNTRKGRASYRHKGSYGKANNYNKHDQKQLDRMESNYEEL